MYNHYLTGSYKNTFFLEAVTKRELQTEIKNLNPRKSSGYGGLSVKVIKNVANEISEPLIKFIDKNRVLTPHQYGFRENRSTELAIIELTNRLTNAIDKGEFTIGIFLDLSKAFDTINHKILIQKLEHYGICGATKLSEISNLNVYRSVDIICHRLASVMYIDQLTLQRHRNGRSYKMATNTCLYIFP